MMAGATARACLLFALVIIDAAIALTLALGALPLRLPVVAANFLGYVVFRIFSLGCFSVDAALFIFCGVSARSRHSRWGCGTCHFGQHTVDGPSFDEDVRSDSVSPGPMPGLRHRAGVGADSVAVTRLVPDSLPRLSTASPRPSSSTFPASAVLLRFTSQRWLRGVAQRAVAVARHGFRRPATLASTTQIAGQSQPDKCGRGMLRLRPPTNRQRAAVAACFALLLFLGLAVLPHAGWILGAGHTFAFGLHGAHCGSQLAGGARPPGDPSLRGGDWDRATGDWDWGWPGHSSGKSLSAPYFSLPLRAGVSLQLQQVAISSSSSDTELDDESAVVYAAGEHVHLATLPALAAAWSLQAAAEETTSLRSREGHAAIPEGLQFLDAACDPRMPANSQSTRLHGSAQELLVCLAAYAIAVSANQRGVAPAVGADSSDVTASYVDAGQTVTDAQTLGDTAIAIAARIRGRMETAFGLSGEGVDAAAALLASSSAASRSVAVEAVSWKVLQAARTVAAPGLFRAKLAALSPSEQGCIGWRWVEAPIRLRSMPDLLLQATVVGAPVCGAVHIRYGGRSGNALLETGVAALLARWLAAARQRLSTSLQTDADASLRGGRMSPVSQALSRSSQALSYAVLPEERLSGGLGAHTPLWTALCPHVPRLTLLHDSGARTTPVRVTNGRWGPSWSSPSDPRAEKVTPLGDGHDAGSMLGWTSVGSLQLPASWFRPWPLPVPLPLLEPLHGWAPRVLEPSSWLPPSLSPSARSQSVWPPTPWTSVSSSQGLWSPASIVLHDRYRWGQWAVQNLQQATGIAPTIHANAAPLAALPRTVFMNHYFERGDMVGAAAAYGWQALQEGLPRLPASQQAQPDATSPSGQAAVDAAFLWATRAASRKLHPFLPEGVASRAAALLLRQHRSGDVSDEQGPGHASNVRGPLSSPAISHERCMNRLAGVLDFKPTGSAGGAQLPAAAWGPLLVALFLETHAAAVPAAAALQRGGASDAAREQLDDSFDVTAALNRSAYEVWRLVALASAGQAEGAHGDSHASNDLWSSRIRTLPSAPSAAASPTAVAGVPVFPPRAMSNATTGSSSPSVLDTLLQAVSGDTAQQADLHARLRQLLHECTLTVHVRAGDVALQALEWDYGRYLAALEASDAAAGQLMHLSSEPAPGGALEAHLREESSSSSRWSSRGSAGRQSASSTTSTHRGDALFLSGHLASVFARYAAPPVPDRSSSASQATPQRLPPLTCSSSGPRSQLTDVVTSWRLQQRSEGHSNGGNFIAKALHLLDPRSWTVAKEHSYPTAASLALARWMSRWQHDDPAALWAWAPQFQGEQPPAYPNPDARTRPETERHYLLDLLEAHCVAQGHAALPLSFYQQLLLGDALQESDSGSATSSVSAIEARHNQRAADLQLLMAAAAVTITAASSVPAVGATTEVPAAEVCRRQLRSFVKGRLNDADTSVGAQQLAPAAQVFQCSLALLFPAFAAAVELGAGNLAGKVHRVSWLHAHLVTERSGLSHPLLRAVAAATGASVQSTSLAGDWATMITARQLALSPSTLSYLSAGGGAPARGGQSPSRAHGPGFGLSSVVHYPGHGFFSWFAPRGTAHHDKGQCMIPPDEGNGGGTTVVYHDVLAAQVAASEQIAAKQRESPAQGCLADEPSSFLFQSFDTFLSRVSSRKTGDAGRVGNEEACGNLILGAAWPPDGYQKPASSPASLAAAQKHDGFAQAQAGKSLLEHCNAATGSLNGFPVCVCEFEHWPAAPLDGARGRPSKTHKPSLLL